MQNTTWTPRKGDIINYKGETFKVLDVYPYQQRVRLTDRLVVPVVEIELITPYKPTMSIGGAVVTVEELIKDNAGNLVIADMIGHEDAVRAVTAQIMQGKTKRGEHYLWYSDGVLGLHRDGNNRIVEPLSNGQARSIIYQVRSLPTPGMQYIIGYSDEEVMDGFRQWLQIIPLPRIRALNDKFGRDLEIDLFKEILGRKLLTNLHSYAGKIKGYETSEDLSINDYEKVRLAIVAVLKHYAPYKPQKQRALLPKSPLLTSRQVKAIYDTLEKMPKTCDLENVWPKPVGVKLFNNSMTAYVVEADSGSEDDEYIGQQTQAYGYFFNGSYGEGEWGYINVDELIECGFEMDLFFDDMFIDSAGTIQSREVAA